jgi:branched-subunit amino acid transport protein
VRRFSELVPVALLTALIAVQALAHGRGLELNGPRLAGLAAAVVALLLRAPFLVVLVVAAAVTAAWPGRATFRHPLPHRSQNSVLDD